MREDAGLSRLTATARGFYLQETLVGAALRQLLVHVPGMDRRPDRGDGGLPAR